MKPKYTIHVWECVELTFNASLAYKNPFREVGIIGEFISSNGLRLEIPGFWDGDDIWKIRFTPTEQGIWTWKTTSSSTEDTGLNCKNGEIMALPWSDDEIQQNQLRRGFIKIHPSGRYFTYGDGTPFYWLGDTLWFLYTKRCDIHKSLPMYLDDRKSKGFTLIQIVAGRPAGEDAECHGKSEKPHHYSNEGGVPYTRKYDLINPQYFKLLDQKIIMLLEAGFVPCIMGMWAWDIKMGIENAKEYWRYLVARYSAYNVIWSIAGEYYFVPDEQGWREIGQELHRLDPYGHPTSAHSTAPHSGSRHYQSEEWYDFNLVQVGHVLMFRQLLEQLPIIDYHSQPIKPVIMSESWYENHPNCEGHEKRRIGEKDIRFATYVPLLQGCIGQSYGAHGIWNWYEDEDHDFWDDYRRPCTWENDLQLPVSEQMKYLRMLMDRVNWWQLEPHPEIVTSPQLTHCYCAAIPGQEYIVYVAGEQCDLTVFVPGGKGEKYYGEWFNPRTGECSRADHEYCPYGSWYRWSTYTPDAEDWVLILKKSL